MRYAREELIRDWAQRGALSRAWSRSRWRWWPRAPRTAWCTRTATPGSGWTRAGPPRRAAQSAMAASKAWFARQAVETFAAAGLVSGTSVYIWRMAGLIGPPTPGDRPGGRHDA